MGCLPSRTTCGGMTLAIQALRNFGSRLAVRCGLARTAKRFHTDETGATAVEFSLVAVPFFALMFAIFETALVLFAQQLLEEATASAARLVRTGKAQANGLTATTFKTKICGIVSILLDCSKMVVDIQKLSSFSTGAMNLTPPTNDQGNLDLTATPTFVPGKGSDIVLVRAFYQWPITVNQIVNINLNLVNKPGATHLLMATAAFRNEPFPW